MPTHIEGLTMGHKNELVCGVGVNDAGYAVCNTVRVGGSQQKPVDLSVLSSMDRNA